MPKCKKKAEIDTCFPTDQNTPRRRYLALRTKESTTKIVTKPLKPVGQRKTTKSTITSKKNLTESTTTSFTQKQEEIISSPRISKSEPTKLTKGTKNIVRNFENLQKHENLQKRSSDIAESSRKEMKVRVKVLEQGTGVRD
jgi:hypothetical protein